jgi:4a-hydroxytetrahydrobiopterin dehydratase
MSEAPLADKSCVPCRGGVPPLGPAEAAALLAQSPGWSLSEGAKKISRHWAMTNFQAAMGFVNRVAALAEAEGHHPDIEVFRWNHVRVTLYTHKIDGLHENDFIMAAKINSLPCEQKTG